jgi:hypothetical protein
MRLTYIAVIIAALLALAFTASAEPIQYIRKETCVTPTVTTANAYGTSFVVGGLQTFTNALPSGRTTGALRGVSVNIKKVGAFPATTTRTRG